MKLAHCKRTAWVYCQQVVLACPCQLDNRYSLALAAINEGEMCVC